MQLEFDVCELAPGQIEYGIFDAAKHVYGDTVDYLATVHDAGREEHARLFCAAPAMLAALTEAAQALGCLGHKDGQRRGDMADRIRAAIAAATGTPTAQPIEGER